MMEGKYKNVSYKYTPHTEEKEGNGILIVNLSNGIESTHIIKNWGTIRIFQYIVSMDKLV